MDKLDIKKALEVIEEEFGALMTKVEESCIQQQPNWEDEAKRAFWAGLEIGASFGACPILPRWIEYIKKRKSELKGGE